MILLIISQIVFFVAAIFFAGKWREAKRDYDDLLDAISERGVES